MAPTIIDVIQSVKAQKYVFANPDRSQVVVVDINLIMVAGIPIDAHTGQDLEYLGFAGTEAPCGAYWVGRDDFVFSEVNTQPAGQIRVAEPPLPIVLAVDQRELATILAALRFHQQENLQGGGTIPDQIVADIATDGGTLAPLELEEVERLCRRLNLNAEQPGLNIKPPEQETGQEPLFRVVYVIDVNAVDPAQAAQLTGQILADHDSLPPIFQVIDWHGAVTTIDLAGKAVAD